MVTKNVSGNSALGEATQPFLSDIVKGEAVQVTPNGSSFGGDNPFISHPLNENVLYGFRGGGWQQGAMHGSGGDIEETRKVYGGNRSGE